MDPHSSALVLERRRPPLRGRREQFLGYGITGIAFSSGYLVALRRFTASSIGPPYTTVWVRDPHGRWVFHTNVEPRRSCPRYFGPLLHAARVDDIEVTWIGSSELYLADEVFLCGTAAELVPAGLRRRVRADAGAVPDPPSDPLADRGQAEGVVGEVPGDVLAGALPGRGAAPRRGPGPGNVTQCSGMTARAPSPRKALKWAVARR